MIDERFVKKENIEILLNVFIVFELAAIAITLVYSWDAFLVPSYWSVVSVCTLNGNTQLAAAGYMTAGVFKVEYNATNSTQETSKPSTSIQVLTQDPDGEILKHEKCHERQYLEKRLYGCNGFLGKYKNELECYVKQKL